MSQSKVQILIEAIDKASTQLQNVGKSVSGLSDKISSLGSTAKVAAGVLLGQLARDALNALTKAAGKASSGFMDYEKTITKIISATDATGIEAEELREALEEVSEAQTDLGFTAADSARGLEALVKAGMSGEDAASALRSALSLAALESISTEESAGLLVQTLTMFGLEAEDSADALNSISKAADAGIDTAAGYASGIANAGAAAHNMGLSLDETLAALIALDKTYGSATESGTYLNAMFKDLIKKSDDLGITLYNQDGTMKTLAEIIGELRAKVKSFGDDQEAVNEYLSVFDVRAQRAVIGLLNYDGSIEDTMEDMQASRDVQEKMNMVMETTAGKTAQAEAEIENASYALGQMTSEMTLSWKQFALGLGPIGAVADALGPSLLQGAISGLMIVIPQLIAQYGLAGIASQALAAAQWLVNAAMSANPIMLVVIAIAALVAGLVWAYHNVDWFREAVDKAGKILYNFFKPAIDAVVGAVSWLTDKISGFISWIGPAWSNMTKAAGSAWSSFWSGAQQFIKDPVGTITSTVQNLAENMKSRFEDVYTETGNVWKATWESLKTIPVVGSIVGAVEGLGNKILGMFGLSMDDVFDVWQGAWQSIQNFLADPIGSIKSSVTGFGTALVSSFGTLKTNLTNAWNSIWVGIKNIAGNFADAAAGWGKSVATQLISGLKGQITNVTNIATQIGNTIKNGIQTFINAALNWGKKLITNFIDGIKSAVSGLADTVSNIGSTIASWLGFGSVPEKGPLHDLMRWGPALTEQFAEGILSGLPKVTHAAETVAGAFSGLEGLKPSGFTGGFAHHGTLQFNAPLVLVQGDASEDTAKLAADLILKNIRKYVVS